MLFILHNTEDGLSCEAIAKHQFDAWVKERVEEVSPEYHPKFVNTMPTEMSPEHEYLVIDGEPVIPKPVNVVTSYTFD
jgi:hypothetical protein